MNIIVRQYNEADLSEMIKIWNEVVEDGIAFPQEQILNDESGKEFLLLKPIALLLLIRKMETFMVCISCILIMWAGAVISAMQAMLLNRRAGDCTSAKSLFRIVCFRERSTALVFFSSML